MKNTDPKKVSTTTQTSNIAKALLMFRNCGVAAHVEDDTIYIHNVGDCKLDVQVSTAEVMYRAEQYDMMYDSES